MKVNGTRVPPCLFVDDINAISESYTKLQNQCNGISRALDTLSLQANEKKTMVIVVGTGYRANKLRKQLKNNPAIIQGKQIMTTDADKYLGFTLSQKGVSDSIKRTFDDRLDKAWSKMFSMKRLLKHPAVQKNGYIRSAITLFRATIIPTLLYSCECWFGISPTMIKTVEAAYRKLLYKFLDIPVHTKYESVLLQLGLKRAKDIIEGQKICYINRIWNEGVNPLGKQLIIEDNLNCDNSDEESVVDEIKRLCKEKNVKDIFETYTENQIIKLVIKNWMKGELWFESFKSKWSQTITTTRNVYKPYHYMTRLRGRAVFLWKVGALRFRRHWKNYYQTKKMTYMCPFPLCGHEDTYDHATECLFSNVKLTCNDKNNEYAIADFLVKLNRERVKDHRWPLF